MPWTIEEKIDLIENVAHCLASMNTNRGDAGVFDCSGVGCEDFAFCRKMFEVVGGDFNATR